MAMKDARILPTWLEVSKTLDQEECETYIK